MCPYRSNCTKLFEGDSREQTDAAQWQTTHSNGRWLPEDELESMARDCPRFKATRGYALKNVSEMESNLPIAFSIVVFTDPPQTERLLRALYQPQNVYCLHVDQKIADRSRRLFRVISGCFENVFIASRSLDVVWGHYTVLEADLICMEELLAFNRKWKYFINLTGQEFPLKTNLELVKTLRLFNGANDICKLGDSEIKRRKVRLKTLCRIVTEEGRRRTRRSNITRLDVNIPANLTFYSGPVHVTVSREFAEMAIKDPVVLRPDESFFAMLQYNRGLKAPGSFTGVWPDEEMVPTIQRFKHRLKARCGGKLVHDVCVFGVRDLPDLYKARMSKQLFANKFHMTFEPLAYDCLEELLQNRHLTSDTQKNREALEMLPFVKHHLR